MKTIARTLATVTFCAAAASQATASHDPVFRFSPEELTTLEKIAVTHDRIESTARDYCRLHLNGTRGLHPWRACVSAVVDEIVAGIDDKRLTAYARSGTVDEELLAGVPSRQKGS